MKIYLIFFLAWINSSGFHRKRGNLKDLRNDGGGADLNPLHCIIGFTSSVLVHHVYLSLTVSYQMFLIIIIFLQLYMYTRVIQSFDPRFPLYFLHTLSISYIPFPFLTNPFNFLHTHSISYIPFPFLTYPFHFLHTLFISYIPFPFLTFPFHFLHTLSISQIPFPFLIYPFPFLHPLPLSFILIPFLT